MVYCINHDKPLMACHDSRETARIISGKGGLVMDKYVLERDGQLDFYKTFLPRVDPQLNIDEIISDSNDGVINGNLLEFKLHVTDLNSVLFQCIKYLSALRVKGKPVPANILIIDVNAACCTDPRLIWRILKSCISAVHQRITADLLAEMLSGCCIMKSNLMLKVLLPCSKKIVLPKYILMKTASSVGLHLFTRLFPQRAKRTFWVMTQASIKQLVKSENQFTLHSIYTLMKDRQTSSLTT